MSSKPDSFLLRFMKGRVQLGTAFWMVFVPVYVVLVLGAGPIGYWWGGVAAQHDLPFALILIVMLAVGLLASIGAAASAWRSRAFFTVAIVGFVTVAFVSGGLKGLRLFL